MSIGFILNGRPAKAKSEGNTPLLWVLRDELGLTGTKYGCGIAQCGACTVHVDGHARRSCVTPLETVAGKKVLTIEGIASPAAKALQEAWAELNVPQCGFCQSGQVMSALALVEAVPEPSDAQIDAGMAGNICRCATYVRIRAAIRLAAGRLRGKG